MRRDIIILYNDFTHGRINRRTFMDRLVALVGGSLAATAILAALTPDRTRAAMIAPDDNRVVSETVSLPDGLRGYLARPAGQGGRSPGIVIVHENRGLNPYIEDVARRAAVAGFIALAPDFLSAAGGTPADMDKAREMIGALKLENVAADARKALAWLAARPDANGKVGIIGFCWGGGVAGLVAISDPDLDAAVIFYGLTPPLDQVPNIRAALLLNYAALDERIDAGVPAFRAALDRAGIRYELYMYEGVNHAFHNDTGGPRYAREAAKLAWQRTIDFLKRELF